MRSAIFVAFILGLFTALLPCLAYGATTDAPRVITYFSWTPAALYIAARIDDPLVVGNQSMPLGRPWQDDAVAIYLDLDPDNDDGLGVDCLRVVISAAGGATVQRGEHGEWRDAPEWFQVSQRGTIRYATQVLGTINNSDKPDDGYQVEMALAWSLLGVNPPFSPRTGGPLPGIGLAVVNYAQGETQAVSCWPAHLTEEDLDHPARWGRMQFLQELRPTATEGGLASATLIHGNPVIDGDIRGTEWMMAGNVAFTRPLTANAPVITSGRNEVSLIAAWYALDPQPTDAPEQGVEPFGPWNGPDSPSYHLQQIREIRRVGIDLLAVEVPRNADERTRQLPRLAALVEALQAYESATSARFLRDYPLLLPALSGDGDADAVSGALRDFYALVPPQYRVMLGQERYLEYPVIVEGGATLGNKLDVVGEKLRATHGIPIGWLTDTDGPAGKLLAQTVWDAKTGVQLSTAGLVTAMIAPGYSTARRANLPRRNGEIFENGWMQVSNTRPNLVVVRSWNDFRTGTAIAPSRQYGYQYADRTRLATKRLAEGRRFGIRVVRHNLPAALRPGVTYPVEMLVKNANVEKLVTRDGYRVDYRIVQQGRTLRAGRATDEIALLDFSAAQLRFTVPTSFENRQPLLPGAYQLELEFIRNRVPHLSSQLLTQSLGTVAVPFVIERTAQIPQVTSAEVPRFVVAGGVGLGSLALRNMGDSRWRKQRTRIAWRWLDTAGAVVGDRVTVASADNVVSGEVALFRGALPAAPGQPGWYRLVATMEGADDTPVYEAMLQVRQVDLRAEFVAIDLPGHWPDELEEREVSVIVRNSGTTPWESNTVAVIYQWLAWDGRAIPGATGRTAVTETVQPGKSTLLRVRVTPPLGAGPFRCAFGVGDGAHPALITAHPVQPVTPMVTVMVRPSRMTPVELQSYFTHWAASSDTVAQRIDFDGQGNAFPLEEFLPDATNPPYGFTPGYFLAEYAPQAPVFRFAHPTGGKAPVLMANGQTIALPSQAGQALHLAAVTTGDAGPVTFIVRYQDDTEAFFTVPISNWIAGASYGEPVMLTSRHLHTPRGDEWYLQGSVYAYRLDLDPAKVVQSLVLPAQSQVGIFAVTLERVE